MIHIKYTHFTCCTWTSRTHRSVNVDVVMLYVCVSSKSVKRASRFFFQFNFLFPTKYSLRYTNKHRMKRIMFHIISKIWSFRYTTTEKITATTTTETLLSFSTILDNDQRPTWARKHNNFVYILIFVDFFSLTRFVCLF